VYRSQKKKVVEKTWLFWRFGMLCFCKKRWLKSNTRRHEITFFCNIRVVVFFVVCLFVCLSVNLLCVCVCVSIFRSSCFRSTRATVYLCVVIMCVWFLFSIVTNATIPRRKKKPTLSAAVCLNTTFLEQVDLFLLYLTVITLLKVNKVCYQVRYQLCLEYGCQSYYDTKLWMLNK